MKFSGVFFVIDSLSSPFFSPSHLGSPEASKRVPAGVAAGVQKKPRTARRCTLKSLSGPPQRTDVFARSYLRLATKDGQAFERLRRYETSLWRQTVQIILLLNSTNRREEDRGAYGRNSLRLGSLRKRSKRVLWPPFTF